MFEFITRWFNRLEPSDIKEMASPRRKRSPVRSGVYDTPASSNVSNPAKIGEGSYGCVYRPQIPCDDQSTESGTISKLMSSKDAVDEVKSTGLISRIDEKQVFHYPVVKKCYPLYKPVDCNKPVNYQLVYEDGGNSLSRHIMRQVSTYYLEEFIYGLWRLFVGLYVLHNNDVYHFDIKPDNIVVKRDGDYIFKFLDFGISKNSVEMVFGGERGWPWYHNYPWHPVETLFLSHDILELAERVFNQEDKLVPFLTSIAQKFKVTGLIENRAELRVAATGEKYEDVLARMRENVKSILAKYEEVYRKHPPSARVRIHRYIYTRIDVYSLGITLLQTSRLIPAIGVVANQMAEINTQKRCGPCRALNEFLILCQRMGYPDSRSMGGFH